MQLKLRFIHERSTKNTERYAEVADAKNGDVFVGTLYVQKRAFADGLGVNDELIVTIESV